MQMVQSGSLVVRGTHFTGDETRDRYREKLARITLDSMEQFVALLDPTGAVLDINRAALDTVGVSLGDVEGRPFWTTFWWQVSPEVNLGVRDAIARAAAGEFQRWETPVFGRADGQETIVIDASVTPIKDERGEVVFLACEGRNITEKKAYEREIARQREELAQLEQLKSRLLTGISHELHASRTSEAGPHEDERRFRTFVEASSDVVYCMSPDWGEMRYLHGRDFIADTASPERSWLGKYIHPDDQERVMLAIQAAIQEKKTFELEHRVLRVDGSLGWTFSRAIPFLGTDGRIVEWLGAASDITKCKEAETALRVADQRKDEFLATLSHELRNPLAPIRNGLYLMRLQGDRPNPKVQAIMERQLDHLVRLVDDLLEMSRITRGNLELRREPVELQTIVCNAIEASQPLIQAGGHRFNLSLPTEALWLEGDSVRLTQVIGNILNNAAKYTNPGGTIALAARREQDSAVISVVDNGSGISAAGLERIFAMFSREPSARERSQGGLGIGLTLSRRLVEMHGGTLVARSDGEGCGSEFIVSLPLVDVSPAGALCPPQTAPLSAMRVLVVDDNVDAASSTGMVIEALGAKVGVASDGASALKAFAEDDYSVVLLDLSMPDMDGYEVARELRNRFPERHPSVVALTGRAQAEDRRRARESGFDHHLVKPVQIEALRALLTRIAR